MDPTATGLTEDATDYQGSTQAYKSSVNLFALPQTDVSTVKSGEFQPFFSVVSTKENYNPLEFIVVTESSSYIDLLESPLALTCAVFRQNGSKCLATDIVAPSNLFFHTMFSNVEIYLNGKLIFQQNNYLLQLFD